MPTTPPPPDAPPLQDIDWYRIVRSQIEFEASLIAQRLSWFVAAQSFLFSAYAITLNAPREPAVPAYGAQQRLLFQLIPVVALASAGLIYFSMVGALLAQLRLRRFLADRIPIERLAPFPPIQGGRGTHLLGMGAPLGLPLVFVGVWIFLFIHALP